MLILTRKDGEAVTMTTPDNQQIKIIVTNCGKGKTRIAFEAPSHINIVRDELLKISD